VAFAAIGSHLEANPRIEAPLVQTNVDTLLLPRSERTKAIAPHRRGAAERSWPRKILVASDGSAAAANALVAARMLGEHTGAEVELLTVYSPRIPLPALADRSGSSRCEAPDRSEVVTQLRSVRRQRRAYASGSSRWRIRLEVGDPVGTIVREAHRAACDLLVLGIGSADLECRRHGQELPACISSYIEVPMLATSQAASIPARRAILVMGESQPHDASLRAALGCMDALGALWIIIHTPTAEGPISADAPDSQVISRRAPLDIRGEIDCLAPETHVRVMHISGDAVSAAVVLAEEVRADLIAAPVHGSPGGSRPFLPNLVERLLLKSQCSVLVVPEPPRRAPLSSL
jgi:nucleotide-binding universal stress UspA family protein